MIKIYHVVDVNIHHPHEHEVITLLNKLFKQNIIIMSALSDIKAKLAISDEKADILTTAVSGVKQDTAFLKKKIEELPDSTGSIDAAGVAELSTIIDAQNTKFAKAADELSALDAETDSTETPAEPTV